MKKTLILAFLLALAGCATTHRRPAGVILEFRPGFPSPGPGLTEMTVPGMENPVYVSEQVLITNEDVKSARVLSGPVGPQIEIVFTKTGREKFAVATERHLMKPIAIMVEGKLLSAPVVREKIRGGIAMISGQFTAEEAERIADGIVGK